MRDIKFKAYLKKYKMVVEVQRINLDLKTIECYLVNREEGDLSEFDFDEIEWLIK